MALTPGRVLAGRIFVALAIGFLVALAPSILATGRSLATAAFLVVVATTIVVWVWFWMRAMGSAGPATTVGVLALTVLCAVLTLTSPIPGDAMVFPVAAAGAAFPARRGAAAVVAISLLAAVIQLGTGEHPDRSLQVLFNDLIVGFAAAGGRLLVQSIRQLEAAREEIARLAVSQERLRFARDLHDLLGQNLAVVVLKSELVARELPAAVDPGLRRELRDVAAVARRSLDDVREAVAGYRRPGLRSELASSRSALRAAGIGLTVEDGLAGLPGVQESVLAWAVREGVTNVARHSHGTRCVVRLTREQDRAVLVVEDDGAGGEPGGGGSGLRGIEERVSRVGGTFAAGPAGGGGFRLEIAVPLLDT
jgi:two-component system sensor histidine kinase DesK